MRERIAYLFMIGVLIMLMAITFGVLGKGHYQPPKQDSEAKTEVSFPVNLA